MMDIHDHFLCMVRLLSNVRRRQQEEAGVEVLQRVEGAEEVLQQQVEAEQRAQLEEEEVPELDTRS